MLSLSACKDSDVASAVDSKTFDLEDNIDETYLPGDNFYMYGIGSWYNKTTVAGTTVDDYAGIWYDAEQNLKAGLKSALAADVNGEKFLADIDNLANSKAVALKSIAAHIHEFDGISTKEEAWAAIAKAAEMGYTPLIKLANYMRGGTIRLLYACPEKSKLEEFVGGTIDYLMGVGYSYDEATEIANSSQEAKQKLNEVYSYTDVNVGNLTFSPALNAKFIPITNMTTTKGGMNVVNAISSALSIDNSSDVYIVNDIGNYLDGLYSLSAEEIKHIIQCEIAQDYMYTSFQAYNGSEPLTPGEMAQRLELDVNMNYFTSVIYSKAVVTDKLKADISQIAEDFRDALKTKISSLDWMSEATKEKALVKLEAMKFWIGRPDKWDETNIPKLTGTSLVEDLRLIRASNFAIRKSLKGAKRTEKAIEFIIGQGLGLASLNGCYEPYSNAIFIFPPLLLSPFYNASYSDAFNYAGFMAIGHEMTHGFDNVGSKFDKDGNFSNWWDVADKKEFENRQQNIIDCYSHLEISYGNDDFAGVYDDGKATLAENMADIGGLHLAYNAYMSKLQRDGYNGDELVKQEKKFFLSICNLWREKSSVERFKLLASTKEDFHSLAKERVNGSVMNTDRWYELFDVKKGNKLYLPPEKRADIW